MILPINGGRSIGLAPCRRDATAFALDACACRTCTALQDNDDYCPERMHVGLALSCRKQDFPDGVWDFWGFGSSSFSGVGILDSVFLFSYITQILRGQTNRGGPQCRLAPCFL